jgi:hypothetical protein
MEQWQKEFNESNLLLLLLRTKQQISGFQVEITKDLIK